MKLTELCEEEKRIKTTQLIGLSESQRKIYECLDIHGELNNEISDAYKLHQEELELLIKYQKLQTGAENDQNKYFKR